MKTNPTLFLLTVCAATLMAVGCKQPPQIKTVAGDSVPTMHTNRFTGTWISGGGRKGVVATRIKDAQAGVVEVAMLNADKDEIRLVKFDVSIRHSPEVGLLWSANEKSFAEDDQEREKLPGNYFFGRLVITGEHFVVHLPEEDEIEKLVERGVLKASYAKNDKGEDTGPPILEMLGKEQFDALVTNGVNPQILFNPDPDFVFTRLNAED